MAAFIGQVLQSGDQSQIVKLRRTQFVHLAGKPLRHLPAQLLQIVDLLLHLGRFGCYAAQSRQVQAEGGQDLTGFVVQLAGDAGAFFFLGNDRAPQQLLVQRLACFHFMFCLFQGVQTFFLCIDKTALAFVIGNLYGSQQAEGDSGCQPGAYDLDRETGQL